MRFCWEAGSISPLEIYSIKVANFDEFINSFISNSSLITLFDANTTNELGKKKK